jgi:hypothetical protein
MRAAVFADQVGEANAVNRNFFRVGAEFPVPCCPPRIRSSPDRQLLQVKVAVLSLVRADIKNQIEIGDLSHSHRCLFSTVHREFAFIGIVSSPRPGRSREAARTWRRRVTARGEVAGVAETELRKA